MDNPQHRLPIQIRFNDVDMVGHVNNVIFGHYCDMARLAFMRTWFPTPINLQEDTRLLILVHTDFDFLRPCFIYDTLFMETRVERVGARSVALLQELVDQDHNVRMRSHSILSTFDKATGTSFLLASCPQWAEALSKFVEVDGHYGG